MSREPAFPPKITTRNGYDRCYALGAYQHLGPTGSPESKEAYQKLIQRILAEKDAPKALPKTATELRVRDVVARFLVHAEQTYSERGHEVGQFRSVFKALLARHGNTLASAFGPKALREVQTALTRPPYEWCRNVVNRQVVRIRTVWRWAESEELVPAGSTAALLTLRGIPKNAKGVRHTAKRKPTSWEDLQAVLPFCPAAPRIMVELQWWCGCRSQDVRLMRVDRIDTSGETWVYTPERDKGDWREGSDEAPRRVYLGPECQGLLISWVEANPRTLKGYLFPSKRGVHYTDFTYAQAVRRASERAGVKILAYGGRHAAKDRVTREMGIDAARAFLGQKSVQTTNLYGTLDAEHAAEVAQRLG